MALSFAYIKIDKEEELVSIKYVDIFIATADVPLREAVVMPATSKRRYVHALRMKKQLQKKSNKDVEAKEFSNTEELLVVKREYLRDEQEE
jgi:hypothetical protein